MTGDTAPDDTDEGDPGGSPPGRDRSDPADRSPADAATRPAAPTGETDGARERKRDGDRGRDVAADADIEAELESMRAELERLESRVDERTVSREDLEAELRRYVRARQRRGYATGWGPYLVLLYGVVMTLGAFFYLRGGWAVAAMLVVWLSTLGLYVVMVLVSAGISATRTLGGLRDAVGRLRS